MSIPPPFRELRPRLVSVLSGRASEADVTALARLLLQLSLTRLRQLMGSGRLHLESFQIPLNGVAFDCIAELFERDADGRFIELESYFSGDRAPDRLDDAELLYHTRGLVFTAVSDGIFRLYREHDPILARILRGIKLALRHRKDVTAFRRFGDVCLYRPDSQICSDGLATLDVDRIESWIAARIRPGSTMPELLNVVAAFLQDQQQASCIRLIDLAVAFKRMSSRGEFPLASVAAVDNELFSSDVGAIVESITRSTLEELRRAYVDTNKLTAEVFAGYAAAIAEILRDTFVANNGQEDSQGTYLQRHVEGMTHDEYRTVHRSQFEYMVRKAKRAVQAELRELL